MFHENRTTQDVRLYVLDTGLIECADFALFSPSVGRGIHRSMTVRSYLVVHARGVLLWDTGIDDAIAGLPEGRRITESIVFQVPKTLAGQLAAIGIGAADIPRVGMSHLHIDHVGNIGLFPKATVIMQEAECAAAYGPNAEQLTYIPASYAALPKDQIQTVAGDYDVFGDGSVLMKPLPGHTPGHQGLLVNLRNNGPVLLAGDIAYSAQDYADVVPRDSNFDIEQTRRSIEAAKRMERELGAAVWLHHDVEAQRDIVLAPGYYE